MVSLAVSPGLPLSREQAAAVTAPLGDVCVTAGAGSGKTRVLTARFLEHVRVHGLAPRRVAALTFTEKAARELRGRVAAALAEAAPPEAAAEAAAAPISTLHGFCARLLRRNALAAGIDPAFRVLDETEAFLLREEARARLAATLEAHPEATALGRALRRVPGIDPLRTLGGLLRRLEGAGLEPQALRWRAGPVGEPQARAQVEAAFLRLRAEARALSPEPDLSGFQALVGRALGGDPVALGEAQQTTSALRLSTGRAAKAAREAREAVGEALVRWEGASLDAEGAALVPALRTLLGLLQQQERAEKARRAALDFDDLERRTRDLLEGLAARGGRPEGLPDALLVDEHQDTNPVQEAILARLRALGRPQFSVGDPKQSIYRFRRADVAVLLGERERVGAAGRRELAESYRATPELVATLNGLFGRLFEGGRAGVPFEPLEARGDFGAVGAASAPAADAPVTWTLLDRGAAPSEAGRRGEAAQVVAALCDLVERRVPRRRRPEGGGEPAALSWRDCAVLVPVRDLFGPLERALAAAGVPYRVHKGRGYLDAEEVRALVHVLRVVHDPLDEAALAAAVRGPALAADDAALLRWFGARDAQGRPLPAFERLRGDEDPGARAFAAAVEGLRLEAARAPLPEVVASAVERFGLRAVALAQPDGRRRAANLRRAVRLAEEVARAGRQGLRDLLAHLEELRAFDLHQAEAPELADGADEVALMTVHAAKGLEWPVVALADVGHGPRTQGEPAYLGPDGALALRLKDPFEGGEGEPGGWAEAKRADDRAAAQESLRLLYVGATRAQERLLLSCSFQGLTKDGRLKGAQGWAQALHAALAPDLGAGGGPCAVGGGSVRVRVLPLPPEPWVEPQAVVPPGEGAPDAARLEAELEARLARAGRSLAPLGGTRFVVGVSELLAFARSPAALRVARLSPSVGEGGARGPGARAGAPPAPEEPPEGVEGPPAADPEGPWPGEAPEVEAEPEPAAGPGGEARDRAAIGSAVHALLERWPAVTPGDRARALAEAFGGTPPPEAGPRCDALLARFEASALAAELRQALAAGLPVRREVAFHARVRFPGGRRVGPFDALLVKGSIDLWLPRAGGLWLVDHKTNAPSAAFPVPSALASHYAWQLRLYALAAERLLGTDVAGASLLLLDPGWGPAAQEVPVDVSGPALEEARRLAEAFARAELEDRWPDDWRALLSG